jgi:hypothetical protein
MYFGRPLQPVDLRKPSCLSSNRPVPEANKSSRMKRARLEKLETLS